MWTPEELREVLGDDAHAAADYFGVLPGGNFEGRTILTRGAGSRAASQDIRERMYEARAERVWPGLDDKRLTSWNALMISALAEAGAVLERADLWTPRAAAPSSSCATCATTTAACCAPSRTARPS